MPTPLREAAAVLPTSMTVWDELAVSQKALEQLSAQMVLSHARESELETQLAKSQGREKESSQLLAAASEDVLQATKQAAAFQEEVDRLKTQVKAQEHTIRQLRGGSDDAMKILSTRVEDLLSKAEVDQNEIRRLQKELSSLKAQDLEVLCSLACNPAHHLPAAATEGTRRVECYA